MVFQKRLDCGTNGYQALRMPYVPKSARGKRSVRKKTLDNQLCAFNLLATVAGNLLLDKENSLGSLNISQSLNCNAAKAPIKEEESKGKSLRTENIYHQSRNYLSSDCVFTHGREINYALKEHSHALIGASRGGSVIVNSCIPKKCLQYNKEGLKTPQQAEFKAIKSITDGNNTGVVEDQMEFDVRPPSLVSSDSSAEVPFYSIRVSEKSTFSKHGDGVQFAMNNDDDENSGCTHSSILSNKASRLSCKSDRRAKKLLVSRHQKSAPRVLQRTKLSNYDVKVKPAGKRMWYSRRRTHRSFFKRSKVYEHPLGSTFGGFYNDSTSKLYGRTDFKPESSDSDATLQEANGACSSTSGQKTSYGPSEYHVKLRIKSFKVPELLIEIPEIATVGSLKRTVMETIDALRGGGLQVGILLQGKKIQDDDMTLYQAGILHDVKLDGLGFTLEPNSLEPPTPLTAAGDSHMLSHSQTAGQLARITPEEQNYDANPTTILTSCPESDHDSIYSPADSLLLDRTPANSNVKNVESMSVVPLQKSRSCEIVQRRIRRPFTVAEVEALVQAVEELGTGRWRDVKLGCFENAKHRTYVDLKDKWKTLVHTAKISPQQRRGEPVPQELLDRVLSAHSYWSQQQQAKSPTSLALAEPCPSTPLL